MQYLQFTAFFRLNEIVKICSFIKSEIFNIWNSLSFISDIGNFTDIII